MPSESPTCAREDAIDTFSRKNRVDTQTIQRQYNEVVAEYYDLDPQEVLGRSLDRAFEQLRHQLITGNGREGPLKVLDVGMGTGRFLARLKALDGDRIQPYGLDLSEKMVDWAHTRIPDLVAEVNDAAKLEESFVGESFDLLCTHFVTGYVPIRFLAPKIWDRLERGGHWSLVAGTKAGFPALQARANFRLVRWLCGAGARQLDELLLNPADTDEVVKTISSHGFQICLAESFEPAVEFPNFEVFMEFAYRGGWFTPIIETLGLDRARPIVRRLLNRLVFPVNDHHTIAVVLARKIATEVPCELPSLPKSSFPKSTGLSTGRST